jgi:hypothetical protein
MLGAVQDDQTMSAHMAEDRLLKEQIETPLTSLRVM